MIVNIQQWPQDVPAINRVLSEIDGEINQEDEEIEMLERILAERRERLNKKKI